MTTTRRYSPALVWFFAGVLVLLPLTIDPAGEAMKMEIGLNVFTLVIAWALACFYTGVETALAEWR